MKAFRLMIFVLFFSLSLPQPSWAGMMIGKYDLLHFFWVCFTAFTLILILFVLLPYLFLR